MSISHSFHVGLDSVKANAVPLALLWALAAVLVVCYSHVPILEKALDPVARWQMENGWRAAFEKGEP